MLELKVLNSLTPVFADKELKGGELTKLFACKNQPVNFQIAFKLREDATPCVPFFLKIKSDLPVSLYYVNNVPVIHTASLKDAPPIGLYPDILLPKSINPKTENHAYPWSDVVVEKGEKTQLQAYSDSWQAVWLSVNERAKTVKSGSYTVTVDAYNTKNEPIGSVTVSLEILPYSLPKQKLIYTNWFHCDCLCDLYNVEVFSDRFFEIMGNYVESAARNGMNMILLPAFTPPLDTGIGKERRTVQLVKVIKEKGKYTFDFSLMKRFIEVCRKNGIEMFEHSHLFTQWGAKGAPKIIVHENGKAKRAFGWETKASGKSYVSFLRQYLKSLKGFLSEQKLEKSILFHISDEPVSEEMIENYQRAKANIGDLLDGYMLGDAVSHIEIYEKGICDTPIAATSSIHDFIGKCDNLWAYYTGGQSDLLKSNRILTVSRERNRMLGVQLYYYGIKGFLHWAFNNYYGIQSCYRFNPALNPTGGFALAGTSYMVYPDFDGGCFQSVRQKIFAEGLLDIRLLSLLARLKGKEVCEAVIEKHFGEIHFDKSAESPEAYIAFINDVYSAIAN